MANETIDGLAEAGCHFNFDQGVNLAEESSTTIKSICVIGLGYIGLPTAAIMAKSGYQVTGLDIREDIVTALMNGKCHFDEEGLDELIHHCVASGNLKASTVPVEADAYLIAVPTPVKGANKLPDMSYVEAAMKSIAPFAKPGNLIVLESTSTIGSTVALRNQFIELRDDLSEVELKEVHFAYCPERIIPGDMLRELAENSRIVGGLTPEATELALSLYRKFVEGECVGTTAETAELSKLTENAFRDVNIAFANELSLICEKANVNVAELIGLANLHPRVDILNPGIGVGGHCIPVDPWFLIAEYPKLTPLIHSARNVNDNKRKWAVRKIVELVDERDAKSVAVLGLSYKPNVDDFRESPALQIAVDITHELDAVVTAYDPNIEMLKRSEPRLAEQLTLKSDEADFQEDLVVVLVSHEVYQASIKQKDHQVVSLG